MKTTFQDFLNQNPNCSKFDGKAEAILIFEYLSRDDSIIRMLESCDHGKPALTPVAREIEELLENVTAPAISFEDHFTKQAVGMMIKCILKPFGYVVGDQKILPRGCGARQFKSASCYSFDPDAGATMRVVKRIEHC
jgi:hypothetical protein